MKSFFECITVPEVHNEWFNIAADFCAKKEKLQLLSIEISDTILLAKDVKNDNEKSDDKNIVFGLSNIQIMRKKLRSVILLSSY